LPGITTQGALQPMAAAGRFAYKPAAMIIALIRACTELFTPPLRRVVALSLALAVASFTGLWLALALLLHQSALFGWWPLDWLVDLLGALAVLGLGITGFAVSRSLPLSETFLVLVGASMMAVFATVNSLVQLITTNEMRGRVMSVYNFAFRGGMPMGNLLTGWLVPVFTAPVVVCFNGLLLVVMAMYFFFVQRRLAAL